MVKAITKLKQTNCDTVRPVAVTESGFTHIQSRHGPSRSVDRTRRPAYSSATMRNIDLERFLLRVALPPLRLGLYVKRLTARRADPLRRAVAIDELQRAVRVGARLARQGWWN